MPEQMLHLEPVLAMKKVAVTMHDTFADAVEQVKITAATPGKVAFELPIEKQHCNRLEIIHGGTIASMVDMGGSLVLASRGLWSTGVSIDLNVTYLSAGGKVGDVIRGEAVCDKCMNP